jgi:uncharacterized protein (TIGR03067 family)
MNGFALLLLAPLVFPVVPPPGRPVSVELLEFQGAWQAAAVVNADGRPATPAELASIRLIVTGDRFTLTKKRITVSGRFTIDPARTPKAIDVVLDARPGEPPIRLRGIYRADGATRRSCFAMPDQERPADFPASPKGYVQFEWVRK